jgi:twitching motility protein PilT
LAVLDSSGSVDLAVELNLSGFPRRFRVSLFHHHNGLAAAMRPVRDHIPSLSELNLPRDLYEMVSYPNGLVLMTGAAGSGKSTTLAALVDHINQTKARHIITLEDPIEFEHINSRSLVHQREVGRHVESFSSGLFAALRESPDVILVGEMRNLATISAALTAAETGHLVLSTLHTNSATSAVDRMIDVFPGHQQPQVRHQLAGVLRAVVTQILIPSTQWPARVPAIEKLVVTDAVACQIRDGRNHQLLSLIQAGRDEGMITLERSLASLVRSNKVSQATATAHARDVEGLNKLVRAAR